MSVLLAITRTFLLVNNGYRTLSTAMARMLLAFMFTLAHVGSAGAESTVTQRVGTASTWKRPINTAPELIRLLREIRLPTGDGINVASFDASILSDKEYLHFYLLSRAADLGWFHPLLPNYGATLPYGATPRDCSDQELSLQSYHVAAFRQPAWCEHYQWKAAKWIFDILNSPPADDTKGNIAKLFFLAETAGGDLTALEVQNAVTGQYAKLKPAQFPASTTAPYRSQFDSSNNQSVYEAWNSWSNKPEEKLRTADLLFFYKQKLQRTKAYGPFDDIRDISTASNIFTSKKSQYFLGNELVVNGALGLDYDAPQLPKQPGHATEFAYAGPFIAVNSLTLDSLLSGYKWGALDYSDFYQPPVISVKETGSVGGMVIATRSLTIGNTILDRPERIWSTIGEKVYPTTGTCTLDQQTLGFALKQVNLKNSLVPALYATLGKDSCFQNSLAIWKQVLRLETDARPNAIMHRYIDIRLNDTRLSPFIISNFEEAVPYFGQSALQRWNVAIAKRLLTEVYLAELSGRREELGSLLRDAESLRGRFLITPSNDAANELFPIFAQLRATMTTLSGKRLLLRGSSFPEVPELAASLFLASASSSDTWLIPTSIRLSATSPGKNPKFGRLWADVANPATGYVRLQFLAEMYSPSTLQSAAKRLAAIKNWKFGGLAHDIRYLGIKQAGAADWIVEDQVRISDDTFLFTIRTKQSFLPVLLAQLAKPPGLPLSIDWAVPTDSDVSSASSGPITGVVGLSAIPWKLSNISQATVSNETSFPARVVTLNTTTGTIPITPGFDLAPGASAPIPDYLNAMLAGGTLIGAESLLDPAGFVDVKSKLDYVANDSSIVPVQIENLLSAIDGESIRETQIRIDFNGPNGSRLLGPISVSLAAFGLPESRSELKLLLPAGFKMSYSAIFVLKNGARIQGPAGVEDGLKISIDKTH